MATMQTKTNFDSRGWDMGGRAVFNDDVTILQDAAKSVDLAFLTVMARATASQKMIALTDIDPALTAGIMTCGAIGGTLAEFAAAGSSSFGIGIDGEAVFQVVCDLAGINSVADTAGHMTAGALGGTFPEFQAVSDGQFGIGIDGNAAIQVGGLDFEGLDTETDIPGSLQCGANGANLGAWQAVGDGAFNVTVNGLVINITGCVFTSIVDLSDVAAVINEVALGRFTVLYDHTADTFAIVSNTTGETSIVSVLSAPGAGTDISGAGFLDGQTGAGGGVPTAGTGGEGTAQTIPDIINAAALGRFFCFYNGDAMVFVSPTKGEVSAVSDLTAGTAGTDISGAAFLNGLAGTNVAGTGGENLGQTLSDIINAELAGRATVAFDGDAFVFMSPTAGAQSAVSVLTAGTTGTDISGASYLNGLTGTGTITAPTGDAATAVPAGIFGGPTIAKADIIAGDVDDQKVMTSGEPKYFNEDQVVLENSLTFDDINPVTGKTIRTMLQDIGLVIVPTSNTEQIAPVN